MNAIVLLVIAIVVFLIAYVTYGAWLAKKWGFDPSIKTPAHTMEDGVDYMPAKAPVLLGHHFSSIAGAGPIVGPIAATIFGWLPVFLWVIIGSIFFGGVHDMGALFLSVRNKGRSLGESIGTTLGRSGKVLFSIFSWLTLLLVVAAFTNIVASTFAANGSAATASLLFILIAMVFGVFVYRQGVSLMVGTIFGVIAMMLAIYLGTMFPLMLSKEIWMIILLGYIFIASVTPVWILLQPRDYLNSFLLYAMLIGGFIGILIYNPALVRPAYVGFISGKGPDIKMLFPMLFVTVACGAISGFHSLVGSGTTSKQLDNEKDLRLVGYGSMLIEGVLAVIAIITVAYIAQTPEGMSPIGVFASGLGTFMTAFGLPLEIGTSFTALAISAFALTSLDTATRLARFIFQEAFSEDTAGPSSTLITNRYVSTGITVVLAGALGFTSYSTIWPIFGSANQLLAAIALIALAVALKQEGKAYSMILIPMFCMFGVTVAALGFLINQQLDKGNFILLFFAVALMILAFVLAWLAFRAFNDNTKIKSTNT